MIYQYTHWDNPVDKLVAAGRIYNPVVTPVIDAQGFAAGGGIDHVKYDRPDGKTGTSYIVWGHDGTDVYYTWCTGRLTCYSAAKMLKMTHIYTSILRSMIKSGINWQQEAA